jgi:ATP-dependent DNA helicase PIF1
MMSRQMLEKLNDLAQRIKRNKLPFGGIQLVGLGDFHQLRPVIGCMAFESAVWFECFPNQFKLTKIYRQVDPTFIKLLNDVRSGTPSAETIQILTDLKRPLCDHQGLKATTLRCRNMDVDKDNEKEFAKLTTPVKTYNAITTGAQDQIDK